MSYTRIRFLGASVRGFNSTIGWGMGQPSTLNVQLVEDTRNGDVFSPVEVGTPIYFRFYDFSFFGLLQKWEKRNASDGLPTYEVVCVDPREILDGTQVILAGYNGSVGTVSNLINVFGYWESQGYGLSYSSEAGIPWSRVRDGLAAICNQPSQTNFGGPLTYHGVKYGLDLSQLPAPPEHYRVGPAVSISLMDLISQICEDGGCDFFVELDGLTIKVRTVSRRNQPPLGTITALTSTGSTVVRSASGLEARNETTSAFVVGGEVTTLYQNDSLTSFWGHDLAGNPILGAPGRLNLVVDGFTVLLAAGITATSKTIDLGDSKRPPGRRWPPLPSYLLIDEEIIQVVSRKAVKPNGVKTYNILRGQFGTAPASHRKNAVGQLVTYSTICDQMTLNASPVSDIIGAVGYPTSTLELRLAKANYESWAAYMVGYRKFWADRIGLTSPIHGGLGKRGAPLHGDAVNSKRKNALLLAIAAIQGDLHAREMRMYEFVRGYADEYLGKKWAVGLPFVLSKQDPETLKIQLSYDIADGGYLPEGSEPLGLSPLNEDTFTNPDGRFRCFGRFAGLLDADLASVSPQGSVAENGTLFLEAHVDPNIIFTPTPAAVVTLQGAVFRQATDPLGDISIVRAVLQKTPAEAQKLLKTAQHGNVGVKVFPDYITPSAFAVPLRSNILCYGPWYVAGKPGKVRFEQDPSLTPWNYGGFTTLNQAGSARVLDAITNMQVSEAGTLELAEPPRTSLGGTLQSGGPNVTNIQVSFGSNGVTTTYTFQTYSPRFGVFTKGLGERLKRLALTGVELRRALRASVREDIGRASAIGNAVRAARAFQQHAPKAVKRESPHDVLVAYQFLDSDPWESTFPGEDLAGSGDVRVGVSSATFEEAVAFSNADDDTEYKRSCVMSWSGLLRPFGNTASACTDMAVYTQPSGDFTAAVLSLPRLDPWKAPGDMEVLTTGSSYQSLSVYRDIDEVDLTLVRPMALRGPLVVAGWGYDWEGQPVPGNGNGDWVVNYLNRSDLWPVGPVDLLWDSRRGVWTCHDVVRGTVAADIAGGAQGRLVVSDASGNSTTWSLVVWNLANQTIASGSKAHALFHATEGKWYAIAPGSSIDDQVPGRTTFSLLYSDSGNALQWSRNPVIGSLQLGNTVVGTGTLWLASPAASGRHGLRGGLDSDMVLQLPTTAPGSGQALGVLNYDGAGLVNLGWLSVVTPTGAELLQNKVLDTSTTLTIFDSNFTLQSSGVPQKQARFDLSSIGSGNTRTYSLPNYSDTLAVCQGAQSLFNKTLDNSNAATLKASNFTLQDPTVNQKQARFDLSAIGSGVTASFGLPGIAASDVMAVLDYPQAFKNKTLDSSCVISSTGSLPAGTCVAMVASGTGTSVSSPSTTTLWDLRNNNGVHGCGVVWNNDPSGNVSVKLTVTDIATGSGTNQTQTVLPNQFVSICFDYLGVFNAVRPPPWSAIKVEVFDVGPHANYSWAYSAVKG